MSSLREIGEFKLIDKIKKKFAANNAGTILGISDDCAVIEKDSKNVNLITTDLMAEGVHFDLDYFSARMLGAKAAAVNLSDIAAMGGTPKYMLVSIALTNKVSYEFARDLYSGIKRVCAKHVVDLIGGDTSSSKRGIFINITVIGEAKKGGYLTRGGASEGDKIYVTGPLGDSAGGLALLKKERDVSNCTKRYLIDSHLKVIPRLAEGRFLAKSQCVTSMIDLSDGAGSDIRRICVSSGVGAKIFLESLPVSKQLRALSEKLKKSAYDLALNGGEDYELLFTVKAGCEEKLKVKYQREFNRPVHHIGEITKKKSALLIDAGGNSTILSSGYDHFST